MSAHAGGSAFTFSRSGKKIDLLDPRPESIDFEDIADHLSCARRYGGALGQFYSVAQHCVVCSQLAEVYGEYSVAGAFVHDFAEAYLTDIPTGVKVAINRVSNSAYSELEDRWNVFISDLFGVHLPWPSTVGLVDKISFSTEVRDLFPLEHPIRQVDRESPAGIKIYALPEDMARKQFCDRYLQLKRKGILK